MIKLNKLLSISSEALSMHPSDAAQSLRCPNKLKALLEMRNGFIAFESALVVFPTRKSKGVPGILEWNDLNGWRNVYQDVVSPEDLCFAHDLFGGQFVITKSGVIHMDPETGHVMPYADSIEGWAERLLDHYAEDTAWGLGHEWQMIHGSLPPHMRLLPKLPFVLGGEYEVENLIAVECHEAMNYWGQLYNAIKGVSDGEVVTLDGWLA